MILLWMLLILCFSAYHFSLFYYIARIFNYNKSYIMKISVCGVINFILIATFITIFPVWLESMGITLFFLTIFIEVVLIFRSSLIGMLFVSVTFTINIFAKRVMAMPIMALLAQESIVDAFSSIDNRIILATSTFAMSIFTINLARRLLPRIYIDTILADNKNIRFLTKMFSILYAALFVNMLTITAPYTGHSVMWHYVFTGAFTLGAFAMFIVYAYHLADLRLNTEMYKNAMAQKDHEIAIIQEMEKEANLDTLTGLYTRDYADESIKNGTENIEKFFVAFIDLDGLKIVNDDHGHDEGDFYIKTVSEMVKRNFNTDTVSRYGGDEIVVCGSYDHEESVTTKLLKCYRSIIKIPELYGKDYTTSISYGVAFKDENEEITAEKIISLADSRMYELKSKKQKLRKVIAPQH